MRIIPYTLRITHYSRAPAAWPGRPKIHMAGYAPRDTHTRAAEPTTTESESEDKRRGLRGTVEMTPSGDVRWTIVRPFVSFQRKKVVEILRCFLPFPFIVIISCPFARTVWVNGPPKAYRSADGARRWA